MNPIFILWLFTILSVFTPYVVMGSTPEQPKEELSAQPKKIHLCLNMIVKNESRIIERCLNSVKDVVDCISICDTGSTDNTVQIIEGFLTTSKIPGKVHKHAWKNFGHNRTASARAAQETLKEHGFPLENSYLLLLDADMMLVIEPEFKKSFLKDDNYLLIQKNNWITYYNTRLIRASLPWECIGVTHEYWGCKEHSTTTGQLLNLYIDDHEDGGCKTDKFERDITLLTQGIKDEPNNERYMFYLAQSHRCVRNYPDAIRWYKARIDKGGWIEEVFYSKYMMGEMYQEMDEWDQALRCYLDAYQTLPTRAEPLQKISNYYRDKGKNALSYVFAKQASLMSFPKDHLLFVEDSVYDYKTIEDLAISAFYTPFKQDGFEAADRLNFKKGVPEDIKGQNRINTLYYVPFLTAIKIKPITFNLPKIKEGGEEVYNPMNSSIIKTPTGYQVVCRTVNYNRSGLGDFKTKNPDDKLLSSKNFLLNYDRDFKLLSQQEIAENYPRGWVHGSIGLEDCRIFEFENAKWFTCATIGSHPCNIGQTLCRLSDKQADKLVQVDKFIPLHGPSIIRCEKNWLPFVKDQQIHAIYSYAPFTIYRINQNTGDREVILSDEYKQDFSQFRGSASPIDFDNGYLMLVHEAVFHDNNAYYLHRFMYLNKDFKIEKISKPFFFKHKGVEYCCGMTIDHSGKQLVLPISIKDQEAHLFFADLQTIRDLLQPLTR